jgi:hypothetical protein
MIPHGPIAILFVSAQATGVIRILPGGGSAVAVRGDGDGATYTIGQDTIVVENSGKSALNYDVELPSMAQCPRLYIRVGDQLLYSRSEGRIHTRAILDTAGRYIIPMRL